MLEYTGFIPQNIAPQNTNRIVLFDTDGKRVGRIGLYGLKQPYGEKLYCFGAISDTHLGTDYETSEDDTKKALDYFSKKTDVKFIAHCGDVTAYGSEVVNNNEFQKWLLLKGEFEDLTIYEVAGNHDAKSLKKTNEKLTDEKWQQYFEHNLFYTVEQDNDLFIFLSMNTWDDVHENGSIETFADKDLDNLETTLNANKDKRIFLFQHCFYLQGSGNPNQSYGYDLMDGTQGERFFNLLKNNTNVIWFHGHSHIIFETQEQYAISNYDNILGCHSIHIPSLTQPAHLVNGDREYIAEGETSTYSQGYVVDVYKNHIVLNGINFVTGEQLPIATYCLDTPLQTIEANTFTDTTGTITT